jgi:tetratricopeptide (TPR) repeat protein
VFHLYRGELEAAQGYLVTALDGSSDPRERSFVLIQLGEVTMRLHDLAASETALREGLSLAQASGAPNQIAEALHILADRASFTTDYVASRHFAHEALALCRQLQRPDLTARVLAALAWATNCLGNYAEAEQYYRDALAIAETNGHPFGIALAINFLGWSAFCEGGDRLVEALTLYEQALVAWRRMGQHTNIAMCLGDMALAANELGDYIAAKRYAEEGLAVAHRLNHFGLASYNLNGLGAAACGLQDFAASRRHLLQSLRVAHRAEAFQHLAVALYYLALLLMEESADTAPDSPSRLAKQRQAMELLALVIDHPGTWPPIRDYARRRQADLAARLPVGGVTQDSARSRRRTLEETVAELVDERSDFLP